MDTLSEVKVQIKKEKEALLKAIQHAIKTRDEAPSAMESHSDTTRNQTERLIIALEEKLKDLERLIMEIPEKIETKNRPLWSTHKTTVGEKTLQVLLVPEGIGGRKIGNVILVSVNSELGKKLTRNF